jgi:hypothetical protein
MSNIILDQNINFKSCLFVKQDKLKVVTNDLHILKSIFWYILVCVLDLD